MIHLTIQEITKKMKRKILNIFSKSEKSSKTQKIPPQKITIDHREKNSLVPSELSKLGFQIDFQQLPVADYILPNAIIERKTLSDLKSSIINKRIFSQLQDLKQSQSSLLIIEGPKENLYTPPLHENAIRGFLLSLATEFQVPFILTENEKETALYLSILAKKTKKEISIRPGKILKTPEERLQFILEGFPNLGPVKVKALLEKFSNLSKIFSASEEELEKILGKRSREFKSLIEYNYKK
jgi:ERCC4-type nuclease